jgi:hypothetical protein
VHTFSTPHLLRWFVLLPFFDAAVQAGQQLASRAGKWLPESSVLCADLLHDATAAGGWFVLSVHALIGSALYRALYWLRITT